jgi:hypothetical protein
VSKDDHGIERSAHRNIKRKRRADLAVRIVGYEIDPANIHEAAGRARLRRPIPRNDETNCRWVRQGVIASFREVREGWQGGADLNREREVTLAFSVSSLRVPNGLDGNHPVEDHSGRVGKASCL